MNVTFTSTFSPGISKVVTGAIVLIRPSGFVVIVAKRDLKRAEGILRANRQPYSVIGVCRVGKGVVTFKN